MERFVQAVVAGGLALVAGLWLVDPFAVGSAPWTVGLALVVGGLAALGWGIGSELRV